ncbi:hypothetical protein RUND412_002248 [Rhizina undulata]
MDKLKVTPAQKLLLGEITRLNRRRHFTTAIAKASECLKSNPALIDGLRDSVKIQELSARDRMTFLLECVMPAEEVVKKVLGEDCFGDGSRARGSFWAVALGRGFVRLLMDIVCYAADCGQWGVAMGVAERVLRLDWGDHTGVHDRIPIYLLHLGKPLESLNFALGWIESNHPLKLTDTNPARLLPFPRNGFGDLTYYPATAFDPTNVNLRTINTPGNAGAIFTSALALHCIFGPCPLATSYLRLGNYANRHILPILLGPLSRFPKSPNPSPRIMGSVPEATDYVYFSRGLWRDGEVREWVKAVEGDINRRKCDGPGCVKVERVMGEWWTCKECREGFYCGRACQVRDWKVGKHRGLCMRVRALGKVIEMGGEMVVRG